MTIRDGSLLVDPIAVADVLAMLPKEDLNAEEQMSVAETMALLMVCNKIELPLEHIFLTGSTDLFLSMGSECCLQFFGQSCNPQALQISSAFHITYHFAIQ
jgi:hypothetical protein